MTSYTLTFPTGTTEYFMDASPADLREIAPPHSSVIITDENIAKLHAEKLRDYKVITIPAGEDSKSVEMIAHLAQQLLDLEAHKGITIIGVGGGVVTDVVGFLAGIYMRGLSFGFVPTTLLAMVDAAVGGKNGINIGLHKNMLGVIRQPRFILFDTGFLTTLPDAEWSNGFAEIIKYGHMADTRILTMLEGQDIPWFQKHPQQLGELIAGCVDVKNKIVHADENETGIRKMLNFGHTAGHAFEMLHHLPHGQAVALGMIVAVRLSERLSGLGSEISAQLEPLLQRFGLPVTLDYDPAKVMNILRMDKKRRDDGIDFVLLQKPGVAVVQKLGFDVIESALRN